MSLKRGEEEEEEERVKGEKGWAGGEAEGEEGFLDGGCRGIINN